MAARRVSLSYLVTAVVLSLGAAAATFHLKHEVRDLERQLAAVEAETARERWAVQGAWPHRSAVSAFSRTKKLWWCSLANASPREPTVR